MSLDTEGVRWCDRCWDNRASVIFLRDDGTRLDLCPDCESPDDEGYRMTEGGRS